MLCFETKSCRSLLFVSLDHHRIAWRNEQMNMQALMSGSVFALLDASSTKS